MIDAIKTVGVVGLGVMGFAIAFLYAQKGYRTLVFDSLEAAMKGLPARRDRATERLKNAIAFPKARQKTSRADSFGRPVFQTWRMPTW